ncbi:MAG TPA: N-glycosylase/DNA lyase [Candidatus Altiarchaeales archaeon]|nr:N-glycosylase/DNA lyase [Candidatus Altiarchaeales archaeon]
MSSKKLVAEIRQLKKSCLKKTVDGRVKEFEKVGEKSSREIFKELCFCILTANYNAEHAIVIQKAVGNGFLDFSERKLAKELKTLGYRYPNTRAKYIVEARVHAKNLKKTIHSFEDEQDARIWFAENVKGLGMKESSHFLRNIGYKNFAIIDFHIVDVLVGHGIIKKPKTISRRNYVGIEDSLKAIGKKIGLNMAELDLYLWYLETGKVLK